MLQGIHHGEQNDYLLPAINYTTDSGSYPISRDGFLRNVLSIKCRQGRTFLLFQELIETGAGLGIGLRRDTSRGRWHYVFDSPKAGG